MQAKKLRKTKKVSKTKNSKQNSKQQLRKEGRNKPKMLKDELGLAARKKIKWVQNEAIYKQGSMKDELEGCIYLGSPWLKCQKLQKFSNQSKPKSAIRREVWIRFGGKQIRKERHQFQTLRGECMPL